MGLFKNEILPVSEDLYKRGFYLPSGITLNVDKIEIVSNKLKSIID